MGHDQEQAQVTIKFELLQEGHKQYAVRIKNEGPVTCVCERESVCVCVCARAFTCTCVSVYMCVRLMRHHVLTQLHYGYNDTFMNTRIFNLSGTDAQ